MSASGEAGVYALLPDGRESLVHAWLGQDYELADIPEFLAAGTWEGEVLLLSAEEVAKLRIRADAESFDHEVGLIQLCLDLDRFHRSQGLSGLRLAERG